MNSMRTRVQATTSILEQLKAIRMSGLQSVANEKVMSARDQEITKQKAFRKLQVCNITIGKGDYQPMCQSKALLVHADNV